MDLNNLIKGDYELFYNFNKERLLKLHLDSEALKEILINIDNLLSHPKGWSFQ